jgi:uncharacterized protein involved in response to NO
MITAAHRAPAPGSAAVLTQGLRPFFLAAGVWSAVALAIWIVMLTTGAILPSRFDPLSWHVHEMLFGFVMAAVAGFLLTAIPNWTKRLPVSGLPPGAACRSVAAWQTGLSGFSARSVLAVGHG